MDMKCSSWQGVAKPLLAPDAERIDEVPWASVWQVCQY